jgi:hypothetical protein
VNFDQQDTDGDAKGDVCDDEAFFPSPRDGAVDVAGNVVLSWTAGLLVADVNGHDVYFGTDFDNVNDANTTVPLGVYKGRQDANSYDPNGLEFATTYYWRIDEVNEPNVWTGDVWGFTTGNHIVVDDFESYVDNTELWSVWDDYWVNGSDGEIFCENDANLIRVPGSQAAKLKFKNVAHGGSGFIGSQFDVQDLTELDIGSDWTIGGVKALTLYLRGDPCNAQVLPGGPVLAAGQPWVELEDTSSNKGYVLHPDANDILEDVWDEWNIDLSIFDACGVTLSAIDRFTIGIGGDDRTGQKSKMSDYGHIWVDDIRLYPPRCRPELAAGDITGDCVADRWDLYIMGRDWLAHDYNTTVDGNDVYQPLDSPANLSPKDPNLSLDPDLAYDAYDPNNPDIVNFKDYAIMADYWLEEFLWP